MSRIRNLSLTLAATVAISSPSGMAEDWATFRGSKRLAVAPDTNLLESWPEKGPALVWESAGAGRGYSSISVANGKLYTLGDNCSTTKDEDEYLTCYDQKSGKQLWATKISERFIINGQPNWDSSRSTPTISGDRVYIVNPLGILVCCDANSGKEVWRKHLKNDLGGNNADMWGFSESPLVDGDWVLCTPGGDTATVVALNKKTGEPVWKCARSGDRGAGHSSIVISNIGGQKVYVQLTASGLMGIAAKDGKLLWTYDIDKTTSVIPTPIIRDDLVFFAVGYNRGGALLKQVAGTGGSVSVKEVYGLNKQLSNKHGGMVLVGDTVFGDTEDRGTPFAADLMTGEEKWRARGSGSGNAAVASADGMLYFLFANGVVSLVKATPESYQEVSHFELPGEHSRPCWAHPVIADGKLYLRSGDRIFCYDIQAK